jgi:hypothetical protein
MAQISPEKPLDDALLDELRKRRQKIADDVEAARKAGEVDAYIKLLPILAVVEDKLDRVEHVATSVSPVKVPPIPRGSSGVTSWKNSFLRPTGTAGPSTRSW